MYVAFKELGTFFIACSTALFCAVVLRSVPLRDATIWKQGDEQRTKLLPRNLPEECKCLCTVAGWERLYSKLSVYRVSELLQASSCSYGLHACCHVYACHDV